MKRLIALICSLVLTLQFLPAAAVTADAASFNIFSEYTPGQSAPVTYAVPQLEEETVPTLPVVNAGDFAMPVAEKTVRRRRERISQAAIEAVVQRQSHLAPEEADRCHGNRWQGRFGMPHFNKSNSVQLQLYNGNK